MTLSIVGFVSAALSPLAMTIGFIIWGKSWQATPYALNLFKCTLAGSIFMIISWLTPSPGGASVYQQSMVILSSVIGIIIGDNTWLMALQMIGAKRVIVIDALKPFCAAFAGYFLLHEPLTLTVCMGLIVSSVGVVMVSTEKEELPDGKESKEAGSSTEKVNYCWGYTLAAINVILDAFGSVLTKQFGTTMNTWEINYLRFGFAAIFMALLSVLMYVVDTTSSNISRDKDSAIEMSESRHAFSDSFESIAKDSEEDVETPIIEEDSKRRNYVHNSMHARVLEEDADNESSKNTSSRVVEAKELHKWYVFPQFTDMTPHQWASVITGVLFVTFLCPAMANYALFKLPLGLCLTLTSLGPVYSLPILCVLWGEKSGLQGIVGSILAVTGIAAMCL